MAGGDMRMRPRIEVGIDAQTDRRLQADSLGDHRYTMKFRARLDVDHQDLRLERSLDFLVRLTHARKNDLARVRARANTTHQLADGNDIEARAEIAEQLENAQVRKRLHRKTNQAVGAFEGLAQNAV